MQGLTNTLLPTLLLSLAIVFSGLLGALVLFTNPWKRTHRMFGVLTINLALWAIGVLCIIHAHVDEKARFCLLLTFMVSAFLPANFYQFLAYFPYQRYEGIRTVSVLLYAGAVAVAVGVFSPWYLETLTVFPDRPPLARYGPLMLGYLLLIILSMGFSVANLVAKLKSTTGIQRRQVEHVTLSFLALTVFASITNVVAPLLHIGDMEVYGPCFLLIMMVGLAYSMIRYHLLDILVIVSRTTVYVVTTSFVMATFLSTVSLVHWLFSHSSVSNAFVTTLLASLIIVLLLQPLKERVQLLLNRIILHRRYNARALIERITRIASQTMLLDELLSDIAQELRQTLGVPRIKVLLVSESDPGVLVTEYATQQDDQPCHSINHDFLIEYVHEHPEPILLEELLHGRPTPERVRLAEHLAELNAFVLTPLRTTSGVVGLLVLGKKRTDDIYIHEDVEVFSTIAGPMATAIENARLYRKLEALNLHLERIMSNMRGGVIAVDPNGIITTINQEAISILGAHTPGESFEMLEEHVAEMLRRTLADNQGMNDVEAVITGVDGENIPIAMSASAFSTADNTPIGAMVLLYNMTQIKRLESNVQRADRLSSIGTLAAGMAHEIKNPLQSIKTFTQLLPERFQDADFRNTFTAIVPPEVQRIDRIVSRLLDFARPKPVRFVPRYLHKIIRDVLALVENQTRKLCIEVNAVYPEENYEIVADDQQLHQVFLNLVLNAVDALKESEERRLVIELQYTQDRLPASGGATLFEVPCAKVAVTDTGIGIPSENIDHLFNPFFTTKADGSGLGLSVVHGIVLEHGGQIDVTSTPGTGTTFTVTFPLINAAESAERVNA